MGYDVWLPNAPKVQKPRSVFNAAALAYIGDCIYEVCLMVVFFNFIWSPVLQDFCNLQQFNYVRSVFVIYILEKKKKNEDLMLNDYRIFI